MKFLYFIIIVSLFSCTPIPEEEYLWVIPGVFTNITDVQAVMETVVEWKGEKPGRKRGKKADIK